MALAINCFPCPIFTFFSIDCLLILLTLSCPLLGLWVILTHTWHRLLANRWLLAVLPFSLRVSGVAPNCFAISWIPTIVMAFAINCVPCPLFTFLSIDCLLILRTLSCPLLGFWVILTHTWHRFCRNHSTLADRWLPAILPLSFRVSGVAPDCFAISWIPTIVMALAINCFPCPIFTFFSIDCLLILLTLSCPLLGLWVILTHTWHRFLDACFFSTRNISNKAGACVTSIFPGSLIIIPISHKVPAASLFGTFAAGPLSILFTGIIHTPYSGTDISLADRGLRAIFPSSLRVSGVAPDCFAIGWIPTIVMALAINCFPCPVFTFLSIDCLLILLTLSCPLLGLWVILTHTWHRFCRYHITAWASSVTALFSS